MRTTIEQTCFALITAALSSVIALPGLADVGGGSGGASSPYIDGHLPDDIDTVTRLRDKAAESVAVNFTTSSGTHVFGQRAGFAYARAGVAPIKVDHGLVGVVDSEKTPRRIDLSIIHMITLVDKDSTTLTLQLDLFPDITPEELVRTRPSYTDLKKKYATTKMIRVRLKSDAGEPLALVGKDVEESAPVKVIALLRNIPVGQKMELIGREGWWAIGSVTEDMAYPYRHILKK